MQRERVSENVYWFQSEIYAQVTAGAIVGPQWTVLIDTLATPEETLEMRSFLEETLALPVRYIINTHYHADHCWGNGYFPGASIIAHEKCSQLMRQKGAQSLESAKKSNAIYKGTKLVHPHLTFDAGIFSLRVGKKNLQLIPTPGHSVDGISILVEEDRVLFCGDAFMPIPFFVDGDEEETISTIKRISKMGLENIVQGHGDIILRGEIETAARDNIAYITTLRKAVKSAAKKRNAFELLDEITIESCGKSRVLLGGVAEELHKRNIRYLYQKTIHENSTPLQLERDT